jgi:hypothetical protein
MLAVGHTVPVLHLLVDTSVWLDLAKRRDGQKLIHALGQVIMDGDVELLVPDLVIEEFNRNRERIEQFPGSSFGLPSRCPPASPPSTSERGCPRLSKVSGSDPVALRLHPFVGEVTNVGDGAPLPGDHRIHQPGGAVQPVGLREERDPPHPVGRTGEALPSNGVLVAAEGREVLQRVRPVVHGRRRVRLVPVDQTYRRPTVPHHVPRARVAMADRAVGVRHRRQGPARLRRRDPCAGGVVHCAQQPGR